MEKRSFFFSFIIVKLGRHINILYFINILTRQYNNTMQLKCSGVRWECNTITVQYTTIVTRNKLKQ